MNRRKQTTDWRAGIGPGFLAGLMLVGMASADTYTVTFELDDTGSTMTAGVTDLRTFQPYANLFAPGSGLTLSTDEPATMPLNLYDSEGSTGEDTDLERNSAGTGLWEGGNLTNDRVYNLLIVNKDTDWETPNDNGGGGEMILDFDIALASFGFEFIDMDQATSADVILTDTGTGGSVTIPFTDFESGSGSVHDAGADFGNRHGNRVLDITAAEVGLAEFDRVVFDLTSSGGIGTLFFSTVPEPASALLLWLAALAALGARRRPAP